MKRKAINVILILTLCAILGVPVLAENSATYEIFSYNDPFGSEEKPFMSITNFIGEVKETFTVIEYDWEDGSVVAKRPFEVTIIYADTSATLTLLRDARLSDMACGQIGSEVVRVSLPEDKIYNNIQFFQEEIPLATGKYEKNEYNVWIIPAGSTFVLEEGTYLLNTGLLPPIGDWIFIVVGDYAAMPKAGDVNNDGKVNIADLIRLSQHFTGNTIPGSFLMAADVNGDGEVNIKDLVRLARWIAEIDLTPLGQT